MLVDMPKWLKSFMLLLLLSCSTVHGQEKVVDHQFNSWWTYGGNQKISDRNSVHTLVSFRRNDFVSDWQQTLVRLGLNHKLNNQMMLTFGGDWVVTWPYGAQPRASRGTECRTFEQLSFKHGIGKLGTRHRYRLEQRYIGDQFRNRLRYRFTVQYPLSKKMFMVAFDELFISFGNGTRHHYFNQNWTYLGFGYKIGKGNIKVGYMNQYLPKLDDIRVESNHTLSVSYGYSFDIRNRK